MANYDIAVYLNRLYVQFRKQIICSQTFADIILNNQYTLYIEYFFIKFKGNTKKMALKNTTEVGGGVGDVSLVR